MKVLIAEDNVDMNEIIVKKLKAEGYDVDTCFNGEEAVDHILYGDYDIAIMDILMPVMSGLDALRTIRRQSNSTPVILLTAKDTIDDKVSGLNAGANDYIVKPFSFDELYARIRAVTRTAAGNTSNVYRCDDLTLDADTHVVKRGDREIELTQKEFALLEYLIINQGRVLSRTKILNHVWGYDYDGGTKIIDVYMNYLRKKIDGDSDVKLLHTIRGAGYVLKVDQ